MEIRSEVPARYGAPHNDPDCIFCSADFVSRAIDRVDEVLVVPDLYPVTPGHLLFVPVEHYTDFFDLPDDLRRTVDQLLFKHRSLILAEDATVTGFNVGMNCGVSAGQTVMHAHIHLIPRRGGDVTDPRGGVRGCVPVKRIY
jgi:diadenosine tetraphosphate (Ap4A) HIT family hydrolase